jgi:hypothetical protein
MLTWPSPGPTSVIISADANPGAITESAIAIAVHVFKVFFIA